MTGPGTYTTDADVALTPGARLGPYEILGLIGAGGMGQVYRAHDARLQRDVALKVIRPGLVQPDHVMRLAREARAAGSLNHPNILAVFDVVTDGPVPYIVSELLQGESLRQRLSRGPLSYRRSLECAIEIAEALAAAHERGICHRDVKPGNVFLTSDGRVKLLDFGLAKSTSADPTRSDDSTMSADTTIPGLVRGTVGYMAPEQVLAEPLDHRADLFALGTVLYEMLSGTRAFHRASTVETMNAVLKDEPTDLLELNPSLPAPAVTVVTRCLQKNREERFQSARDLAFHLEQVRQGSISPPRVAPVSHRYLFAAAALLAAAAWVYLRGHRGWQPPTFEQLTFQRGRISGARFDASGIVYSQELERNAPELWLRLAEAPEPRQLGRSAELLASHPTGLALLSGRHLVRGERFAGTLSIAPLGRGAPKEVLREVEAADWATSAQSADQALAVVISLGAAGGSRLQYPPGRTLYETPSGAIHCPRISRDGRAVAFLEDATGLGTGGHVRVVERDGGESRILTGEWPSARGLAWSPTGGEIWFTAAEGRGNRLLHAVSLQKELRLVVGGPGSLTLWDVSRDGRVLLTRDDERRALVGVPPGESVERDLSWFDTAGLAYLSTDGRRILFGDRFGLYLRPTDGAPAVSLGMKGAFADDLSPDGTTVLATTSSQAQLMLVPTGEGGTTLLPTHGIGTYRGAKWLPDGKRIVFTGSQSGTRPRSFVMELPQGVPRPVTPEGVHVLSISPDGRLAAAMDPENGISIWPIDGGEPRFVPGARRDERPVTWSSDGRSIWVFRRGEVPAPIHTLQIDTGRRQLWKILVPPDPVGVYSIDQLRVTPSGDSYFYSYNRVLSELYEVVGVR